MKEVIFLYLHCSVLSYRINLHGSFYTYRISCLFFSFDPFMYSFFCIYAITLKNKQLLLSEMMIVHFNAKHKCSEID